MGLFGSGLEVKLESEVLNIKDNTIKSVTGIPTQAELTRVSPNTFLLDEQNGVLHVIGKSKKWKFQGVEE